LPVGLGQPAGRFRKCRPTACVTGAGAGVDSAWEQYKLEAKKMLESAAESPAFSARCVGRPQEIINLDKLLI
jgi:hypothetical protein